MYARFCANKRMLYNPTQTRQTQNRENRKTDKRKTDKKANSPRLELYDIFISISVYRNLLQLIRYSSIDRPPPCSCRPGSEIVTKLLHDFSAKFCVPDLLQDGSCQRVESRLKVESRKSFESRKASPESRRRPKVESRKRSKVV